MARPSGTGRNAGEAFRDFISNAFAGEPRRATSALKLRYLTSKRFGIGDRNEIAEAIGVSRGTLVRWIGGKQKPSPANRARIEAAYWRRWEENHRKVTRANLVIKGRPAGSIKVGGKPRDHLTIGDSFQRDWEAALDAGTDDEAESVLGDFIEADSGLNLGSEDDSNGIIFEPGGTYTIEVF